jgi:hypothetical protein
MESNKLLARLSGAAIVSSVLLFSACGGSSSSSPPVVNLPLPPEGITLASTYTDLVKGSQMGQTYWTDGSGTGATIDGIGCITSAQSDSHTLISIYKDGVRLALPAQIGLNGCEYETHTHDRSGVVYIEPNVLRTFTLGQFFSVWGQPISRTAVAGLSGPVSFYVIENETLTRFDGDPAGIAFAPHKEIVIITGTTPSVLPKYRWPADL